MAAFTFREKDVTDPLRVELDQDDAPYGHPQDFAAFESGGEHVHKRVKLPGRREPIYHSLYVDDDPLTVRGAFRDYLMGAGHAEGMRRRIEKVRERFNLLRITWGGSQWEGLLHRTKFGHEGDGHLSYELTFTIALPPAITGTAVRTENRGDADALERVLADLKKRPLPPAFARDFASTLDAGLAAVENAIAMMSDAALALEVAQGNVARQVSRVTSLNAQVQQLSQQTSRVLESTGALGAGIVTGIADTVAWTTWALPLIATLRTAQATARSVAHTARQRVVATQRLYRVKPGDTLESIARAELGDASRAGDLGATPAQLQPGTILRLPSTASGG